MNKQLLKDAFGWGFALWLIGYGLGIIFFSLLPLNMIGWAIMPIGAALTSWVLIKKVKGDSFKDYLILALVWTAMAVALDYFFLVKALKPADGYYKLTVYLYYTLTFLLPLLISFRKHCCNKQV